MRIYNSLSFKKEEFKTIEGNSVKMYVCGPTVYDSPHLGHAKSAVAFDIIHRYLKYKNYNVNIIKNYTDIDDKIIQRANELNVDFKRLSEKYIREYEEVMKALNIEEVTKNPRATEVIPFMIEFIKKLIKKGYAYEKNGSVYFSVKSFPKYDTVLQNVKEDIVQEEEEDYLGDQDTTFGEDKLDPRDFALWKKMKEGEPFWESPWSKGRPGWHIECSSMALNFLGETIDIHGGGQDLKFPHHRNEIAQSESYTGKPFAHYFLHNGFVNINDEKMSKSLGNFFLVSDLLKKYDPMVIRLFLISSHYRSSINYTLEIMDQAKKNYTRLINTIKKVNSVDLIDKESKAIEKLINTLNETKNKIINAMDDDFDTTIALAELFSLIREINKVILEEGREINSTFKDRFFQFINFIDQILGIFPDLEQRFSEIPFEETDKKDNLIKSLIEILGETRKKLREKKIYDISDYIREKLIELGIDVEDKKINKA
ncbi:MAG: cysteine--tRNA ligase [Candidatus Odinarchaeota archaeon]